MGWKRLGGSLIMALSNQGLYGNVSQPLPVGAMPYLSTDPTAGTLGGQNSSSPTGGSAVAGLQPGQTLGSLGAPNAATSASATGGAMPTITNPNDPAQVQAFFAWLGTQPNTDPILKTPQGQQYYTQQAIATGGLTDTNYWSKKGTLAAYGGSVGSGAVGGSAAYQGGPYSLPSAGEFANSPGLQWGLNNTLQGLERGFAGRGDLLTGGALKGLVEAGTGYGLQKYGDYVNQTLGANQANFGNLYNLSNLGANAVTGAAG